MFRCYQIHIVMVIFLGSFVLQAGCSVDPDGDSASATPRVSSTAALVYYASQSNHQAFDQGDGGGNPFASALIELLERPELSYREFRSDLASVTEQKSAGRQIPEAATDVDLASWSVTPRAHDEKRIALVFVFSEYQETKFTSLPGAKTDLTRVAAALKNAGFEVQTAIDPTEAELEAALERFAGLGKNADVALLYSTGHGFEHRGKVYLIPSDFSVELSPANLSEHAIHVSGLTTSLTAVKANLLLFGGCRSHLPSVTDRDFNTQ